MAGPSEYGVRLTPGIARGLARELVHDEVIRRYGLDHEQLPELTEKVARRLMEAAHELDSPESQAVAERFFATVLKIVILRHESGGRNWITPEIAQPLARDLLPFVPHARELLRKVAQDIRPALPMGLQLRMAADLATVSAALDGFEEAMKKWAEGQVQADENPFHMDLDHKLTGESGAPERVERARKAAIAHDAALKSLRDRWTEYVTKSKQYYGFNESQASTADSVLREILERVDAAFTPERRKMREGYTFWMQVIREFGRVYHNSQHPLTFLIVEYTTEANEEYSKLWWELQDRIERIPTDEQRQSADSRMEKVLADSGWNEADETLTASVSTRSNGGSK